MSAFIDVYENSKLEIDTCEFENIFSIGSGSVLLANYKENEIDITNSNFLNNYSILGGVFYAQFASKITCTTCTFENNVAIRGGVAFLNSNGIIHLTDSTMSNNRALNAPVTYISACNADYSQFDNVTITDNVLITMDELLDPANNGVGDLDSKFVDQVSTNREFYEKSVSGSKMSMVSMIKGKIKILNQSRVFRQPNFLASFESEIIMEDSTVEEIDVDTDQVVFHLLSTNAYIRRSTI